MGKILIVDDDPSHRAMLRFNLSAEGHVVTEAEDGDIAIQKVEGDTHDVVLLDLKMERMDGIAALRQIRRLNPALPVIIMTAYASVETAVEALKIGAYDYMTKPLDTDEVLLTISRTLERFKQRTEVDAGKEKPEDRVAFSQIIGQSKPMQDLFEILAMASPSDATILITGESGTGKEMVARAVYCASQRKAAPFVPINCAAIPGSLLESELFGHEKGAFTGAEQRRIGKFEQADKGTIFLDEIGDMSGELQAKLLRVLQEKEVERLGGDRVVPVDVRVIAATNQDLEAAVREGRFREDLYFRLSVVPVVLPPLRERRLDIPGLADHFLKIYSEKNRRMFRGFTPQAIGLLVRYIWPGNVRELENTIERAVILCRGEYIDADCLPKAIRESHEETIGERSSGVQVGYTIDEMEKELITRTLEETGGNRTRAAKILGIARQTLLNRLKDYGIT